MKTILLEEKDKIEAILSRSEICFVGMVDDNSTPYVIPMNFGYKDGIIYLHSAPTGRSLDILSKNNLVCISFSVDHELVFQHPKVACSYRMKAKSILCYGRVNFIEQLEEKIRALDIIMRHYSGREFEYGEPAVRNVKVWQVLIDEISAKEYGAPHY